MSAASFALSQLTAREVVQRARAAVRAYELSPPPHQVQLTEAALEEAKKTSGICTRACFSVQVLLAALAVALRLSFSTHACINICSLHYCSPNPQGIPTTQRIKLLTNVCLAVLSVWYLKVGGEISGLPKHIGIIIPIRIIPIDQLPVLPMQTGSRLGSRHSALLVSSLLAELQLLHLPPPLTSPQSFPPCSSLRRLLRCCCRWDLEPSDPQDALFSLPDG